MKKRVLPVLLAGLMVLGFSGCQKADPTEILQNAMTKTQSLESVEYDAGLSFDAEISGMRIGMDLDMNSGVYDVHLSYGTRCECRYDLSRRHSLYGFHGLQSQICHRL